MKLYPTADALRDWSAVYRRNGKPDEAKLLLIAAELIERAERNPEMAVHLAAFAIIAEEKGKHAFAGTLSHASQLVAPIPSP